MSVITVPIMTQESVESVPNMLEDLGLSAGSERVSDLWMARAVNRQRKTNRETLEEEKESETDRYEVVSEKLGVDSRDEAEAYRKERTTSYS